MAQNPFMTSNYDKYLTKIEDKDSLLWFNAEIISILSATSNNEQDCVRQKPDLNDKWNLVFSAYSADEVQFNYGYSIHNSYITNQTLTLTTSEIFSEFDITNPDFPLCYLPSIFERTAKFNIEWTAIILNSKDLLIRMIWSYPYGNQHSWYRERTYYFKKESG
jgi:hypothetical protein